MAISPRTARQKGNQAEREVQNALRELVDANDSAWANGVSPDKPAMTRLAAAWERARSLLAPTTEEVEG